MPDRDAVKSANPPGPAHGSAGPSERSVPVPQISLVQRVEEEITAGRVELPVMPETALKVRDIVQRDGPIGEISRVIESDPTLAAEIIRYSNSVAFSGLREVSDLSQAITRLGTVSVQQTVLALSLKHVFKADSPADERIVRRLWDHSVTTALAARRLATRSAALSTETTFLSGLLHDIGKIVLLRCAAQLRGQDAVYGTLSENVLFEFFDSLHCRIGDVFLESWNIPQPIRTAVRRHHDPELVMPADELIITVSFASKIAAMLGASLQPRPDLVLLDQNEASQLKLNDLKLASLLVDIEDDLAKFHTGG